MHIFQKRFVEGRGARRPAMSGALASISRSGRVAAFRRRGGVELCATRGERRRTIEAPGTCDFGFGAGGFWLLGGGYAHWMTEDGESRLECVVGDEVRALAPSRSALPSCILSGRGTELCELYDGQLFSFPLVLGTRIGERVFPIGPRLLGVATAESFRLTHLEKGNLFAHALEPGERVRAVSAIFGGSAVVVILAGPMPTLWLLSPRGETIERMSIGRPELVAVAEDRGIVVIGTGNALCSIDVRHGGAREWAETPFRIDDVDICARARELVVAQDNGARPRTWHVRYQDIFRETI